MNKLLIAVIGIVYACISADQLFKGNIGTSIAFFGYAIGNIGLYMVAA